MKREDITKKTHRIVLKIGTNVLTSRNDRIDTSVMEHIVEQVALLIRDRGIDVIIVTSGAIAAGMQALGWKKRPKKINRLQAAASVGQSRLMRIYERLFKDEGFNVGQILLTGDIFDVPERKKNAKRTIEALLKNGIVPVVNENDSVAVDEIKFGDNDILSALVAELLCADALIIATDVDGLYTCNPSKKNKKVKKIWQVSDFKRLKRIEGLAEKSKNGMGGMYTKIKAVESLAERGGYSIIVDGKDMWSIKKAMNGKRVGTIFLPLVMGKTIVSRPGEKGLRS